MNRKNFLLALVAFVTLVIAAIFFLTLQQPNKNQDLGLPKATKEGLAITNAQQYASQLDWSVITSVQSAAYRRIVGYGHAGTYNGVIRKNSFQVSYALYNGTDPAVQVPQYQFLLDIPAAKQSYYVRFSGGTQYPYSILYVLCPNPSQLIYGNFGCVDEN